MSAPASKFMHRLGSWVTANPFKTLFLSLLILAAPMSQLPKITVDTSTEGFLFENDPILVDYNKFREQYGQDERVMIAIGETDVFNEAFLTKLKALHERLQAEVPYLFDITSLVNARNTRGEGDNLIVEDLLEKWPQTPEALAELKARALGNRFYTNLLLSEDGRFTAIVIEPQLYKVETGSQAQMLSGFDDLDLSVETPEEVAPQERLGDREYAEIMQKVKTITAEFDAPDFPVHLAGSPVVTSALKANMQHDMQTFMKVLLLMIAVVLYLMFRRVSGMILPIVLVLFSLLATVGFMAFLGAPIKLPTQVLPSMLLAVGTGASVHVLTLFYRNFDKGMTKKEAVVEALDHSGIAIIMTSLTTMAGIGSFATANVAPIADLGIFGAFGVFVALLVTLVMLPALLVLLPLKTKAHHDGSQRMDILLHALARMVGNHPKRIVIGSAVLLLASLAILTQVKLSHYPLMWFPKDDIVRTTTLLIDEKLKGTTSLEFVFDTKTENGWYDPQRMAKLNELERVFEETHNDAYFVGKAVSLATVLKEINRALNENRESAYVIPDDRNLIAQEYLLFANSGSDDLEDVTDSQFSQARMTLKSPYIDAFVTVDMIKDLEAKAKALFPEMEQITVTGVMALLGRTFSAAVESAAKSYLLAIFAIGLMMMLLLRNVKLGLLSLVPNLTPIIIAMAVMVLLGMPLDMFTMLVGSIVMGLAIDDTVHFMHNFRRYYHKSGDALEAIHHTFATTGRAIIATSVVLGLGFFVYIFAMMGSVVNFGVIAALAIMLAMFSNLILAPAMMILFVKSQPKGEV